MRTYRTDENAAQGLRDLIDFIPERQRCTMVEIGTSTGEAAIMFAAAFDHVLCIDNWINADDYYKAFLWRTKDVPNIHHIRTHSLAGADHVDDASLDFVYIDACHTAPHPANDIAAWLPKIKPGGYIGGHDYDRSKFPGVADAVDSAFDKPIRLFKDTSWLAEIE